MCLKPGDKAPNFKGTDDQGNPINLSDFKGHRLILYFYPRDLTPGCTTEACEFNEVLSKLKKKKVFVVGVSRDTVEKHQKFKEKYSLKFPLIADVDGKICKDYGVWQEKKLYGKTSMGIVRTTFVIGGTGEILEVFEKVRVKGHVDNVLFTLD